MESGQWYAQVADPKFWPKFAWVPNLILLTLLKTSFFSLLHLSDLKNRQCLEPKAQESLTWWKLDRLKKKKLSKLLFCFGLRMVPSLKGKEAHCLAEHWLRWILQFFLALLRQLSSSSAAFMLFLSMGSIYASLFGTQTDRIIYHVHWGTFCC